MVFISFRISLEIHYPFTMQSISSATCTVYPILIMVFLGFKTILEHMSIELFSNILSPQCCKFRISEDLTENVIIGLTIAL